MAGSSEAPAAFHRTNCWRSRIADANWNWLASTRLDRSTRPTFRLWAQRLDVGDVQVRTENQALALGMRRFGNSKYQGTCAHERHFGMHDIVALAATHDDPKKLEGGPVENLTDCVGRHDPNSTTTVAIYTGFFCGKSSTNSSGEQPSAAVLRWECKIFGRLRDAADVAKDRGLPSSRFRSAHQCTTHPARCVPRLGGFEPSAPARLPTPVLPFSAALT